MWEVIVFWGQFWPHLVHEGKQNRSILRGNYLVQVFHRGYYLVQVSWLLKMAHLNPIKTLKISRAIFVTICKKKKRMYKRRTHQWTIPREDGIWKPLGEFSTYKGRTYRRTLGKVALKNCKVIFCQNFGQYWSASWSPIFFCFPQFSQFVLHQSRQGSSKREKGKLAMSTQNHFCFGSFRWVWSHFCAHFDGHPCYHMFVHVQNTV